jgi:predicted O-linked N-acetylglucosamine transferase (SPINDLY family)
MESLHKALTLQPGLAMAYDSRLLALNYLPEATPAAIYEEHRRYAAQFEAPLQPSWSAPTNTREPARRMKIGYVSPDFRLHPVAFFIEPVLAHHDRREVEVYCYYNNTLQDAVTARMQAYADHWLPCQGTTDEALAARIRADGIDILVDLAGHTAGNRLLVFARKPAPVQVTYLGYVATTGLTAIDYRLSHIDADPAGAERYNSERLYRLPRSLWCYRPPLDMPAVVTETPARRSGHISFGSLNNIAKVSDPAVALWSRLLQALPGSRLIMAGVPPGSAQQHILARFAAHGIAAARLELHPKLSHPSFRELHHRIDIALDAFPHNGNTTTCESLWMGVPVISLIGDRFVARFGYTLLKGIGLADLAARDEAAYLAMATGLAADLDRLDALRAGMRARIASSALRDEAGFTRDLEAAYRAMWRAWCAL